MKKIALLRYFSLFEISLWTGSLLLILISHFVFKTSDILSLCASIIGATSLIFCAKGNPIGQILMIIFSILYGIISYSFSYYGEMITYLCMTLPMAVFSLISWLRNPYNGRVSEVRVNNISLKETVFSVFLTLIVTLIFAFILKELGTANLITSTFSVTTSFFAAYLTFRRSPFFALAYATNDIVLIILWIFAALEDISYLSVIICFIVFLFNDLYGFISWLKMEKKQKNGNHN
ncbi:MAG: nicotinamide mononucleotide transporter [Clostridia bacterium]|nr:nicotinamide mononucleotide transporter [Clostridia bacterium]